VKLEKVRWELVGVDVEVIEWTQQEARDLIAGKRFQNQEAYEQYVLTHTVENLSDLAPSISYFIEK
jgi:hypothetical protein